VLTAGNHIVLEFFIRQLRPKLAFRNRQANLLRIGTFMSVIFGKDKVAELEQASLTARGADYEDALDLQLALTPDINVLLTGNIARLYQSLQYRTEQPEFQQTCFLLCKLFTVKALLDRKIESWGRLRLIFSAPKN